MKTTLKTIALSDNVGLYSICIESEVSEFEKFITAFREQSDVNRDFLIIIESLRKIIAEGVFERNFRMEGKMNDGVCALSIDSRRLRLYCLRISDQVLIVGNGGVKNSRTYNEDPQLNGHVINLQKFERLLRDMQKSGIVTIEKNVITGIERAVFEL